MRDPRPRLWSSQEKLSHFTGYIHSSSSCREDRNISFECQQCGECCSYLGQVFHIIKPLDQYTFQIENQYTGQKHVVTVSPLLRHLYDDHAIFSERPEACPFFRRNNQGGLYYCTVHLTRPEICQEYGCWRFLFLDESGNRAGRVMQSRHLHAESPYLREIWDTCVRELHEPDDAVWDQKMCDIVKKAGFQIRS
ncbi:YkgJ family cysteine cluster protein [uncultured Methanospirillum sp.]|uniref:YkgJ family cysteine cluster protein n=1 Tax=uncultured Methanospirillum sp. TaxID=262503 RepID=UPI0029C7BCBB|nr:YkgJ family cysteine cluster protein [uncultured Methanospirillum sp.]